jgi:hypothetical protein
MGPVSIAFALEGKLRELEERRAAESLLAISNETPPGDAVRIGPAPVEFPANREFYREFRGFGMLQPALAARTCCAAVIFRVIPER